MNNLRWYSLLMMAAIYLAIFMCKEKTNKQDVSDQSGVHSSGNLKCSVQDNFNQLNNYLSSIGSEPNQQCSTTSMELLLMIKLKKWKTILKVSRPHDVSEVDLAIWHYARGIASLNSKNEIGTREAIKELNDLYFKLSVDQFNHSKVETNSVQQILLSLHGEITSTTIAKNMLAVSM